MKKIIGIPGYTGHSSKNFGVANTYLEFASKFGNPRILMPWEDVVQVDLLLLPGGLDAQITNPMETPSFNTSNHDVFKEHFFRKNFQNYLESGTPIFAICLGMQMVAQYFGSKITQDLMFHDQSSSRWSSAHKIYSNIEDIYLDNAKKKISGHSFKVNSHHHQGITLNNLNLDELKPLFYSENPDSYITGDEEIVEVYAHNEYPVIGVQYHPEELYDHFSIQSMKQLLNI